MRTSFANVTSVVALVVALGGTGAWAAGQITSKEIGNGQVKTKDIRDRHVKSKDIARKAVRSAQVRDDALTGDDVNESTLKIDERGLSSNLQRYDAIPAGVTVRGAFGFSDQDIGETVTGDHVVSFPAPAPVPLDDNLVNFAPDDLGINAEFDEACTGSAAEPTAPAGKVCLYVIEGTGQFSVEGDALPGAASRFGFRIEGPQDNSTASVIGTWAYTAP